ncbi:glucan endo-1,3-beta-glucosidase, acidic-like [Camellia sinensis]|uniref:glucan endo-1,3-beta-glucosidase, acidic-like n=1 Tax=Camellia sinensis TaxID=4442 RepID=UPI001036A598|nr:glucan endo-1,3-beta-glucosidase, acidic-like [Camellia sinensis]
MENFLVSVLLLVLFSPTIYMTAFSHKNVTITDAQSIGVCNGQLCDNLPSDQVVQLYQSNGIGRMRMYGPNPSTLQALGGSNIELVLDVPNSDLPALRSDPSAASQWVQTNVGNYFPGVKFQYIAVGNEVDPNKADTAQYVQFVLRAMQNVYNAIAALGLQDQIKVSTATYSALVSNSYPPSQDSFDGVKSFMEPIIQFLAANKSPLLANIYPYFAYNGDQQHITLPYARFTASDDQSGYQNLFDAMLDAMYSAVEKAGGPGVEIVVSESGWPSDGGSAGATLDNAGTYYKNLIQHVNGGSGTPKRPGKAIETYLFAMLDENKKDGTGTEQHFGLFSPNKQPKYQIAFN